MNAGSTWKILPRCPSLADNEIHVLCASLESSREQIAELEQILTMEERARAQRYHFKKDGDRFIVARGLLRSLLGRYLNCGPAQLRFSHSQYGKPFLEEAGTSPIHFNVSHSGSLVLYAFAIGRQLGVDIERIRQDIDAMEVARHFFSETEVNLLNTTPAELQIESFFQYWTRKEAYVKARGDGIHFGLRNFDVSLRPGESHVSLSVQGDSEESSRWSFRDLSPHPDYKASLAAEGNAWHLECWHCGESEWKM